METQVTRHLDSRFSLVMLLCLAYSCNIGARGTHICTPPNAIVYGTGLISIPQMAHGGFIFNILVAFIITGMMYLLLGHVFNVLWGN